MTRDELEQRIKALVADAGGDPDLVMVSVDADGEVVIETGLVEGPRGQLETMPPPERKDPAVGVYSTSSDHRAHVEAGVKSLSCVFCMQLRPEPHER